jgi:hypothetical protein
MNNKKFTNFFKFIGFIVLKNSKNSINSINALYCLLFALLICIPSLLEAKVTGVCSNCHTMHNSQNGQAVARGDAPWGGTGGSTDTRPNLLVASCLGCHSSTGSETIVTFDSNKIPIVFNTGGYPAKPLAGGNFYWVQIDDTKGHNIFSQDSKLSEAPGGGYSSCGTNNCHKDLYSVVGTDVAPDLRGRQGCTKCHLFAVGGTARRSGVHHTDDGTGTKYVDSEAKGWYRFLSGHMSGGGYGVKGIEDEDWQYTYSSADHNEYWGVAGNSTTADTDPGGLRYVGYGVTGFCTGCHGKMHAQDDTSPGASPWLRHPSDAELPNSGEYAAYTTYDPLVPVARPSSFDWSGGPSSTITPGSGGDMVMCLSCHRAHASPYFKMMRWDYKGWPGSGGTNGCNVCHTSKQ